MKRSLTIAFVLATSSSGAQGLAAYNRALTAYNGSTFDEAARLFFEVGNGATDGELKQKADFYLASSLQKAGLPFTAFIYFAPIVKAGPSNPFHLRAVEALVVLQDHLEDDYLIPSLLNNLYDKYADAWATLPLEVLSRINYLIGRISHRLGKLDEARQFLEAVPFESSVYVRAQYMLGITLADPRFPAAGDDEKRKHALDAIEVFAGNVLRNRAPNQKDLAHAHQLANLAIARLFYGLGDYQRSVDWYGRVPRFSKYWDQALFENGFARFQSDDPGGALGSLQALHAPQFSGAFQPESWILKSTIYYFACLYDEAKGTLMEFERIYLPMLEALKPQVEGDGKDNVAFFNLVDTPSSPAVPRPVLNWVRSNERMLSLFAVLREIDSEKREVEGKPAWGAAKLSDELITYLDQNRGTLEQVAGRTARNRLVEAYRTIKAFSDQAEIIRFEIAKAEKELAEAGLAQDGLLAKQVLFRPRMPAESWNYWRFQGEFWRDEIGYYQYTLKSGCLDARR
jgi:tetratricopeptide (TPR) repeat protein